MSSPAAGEGPDLEPAIRIRPYLQAPPPAAPPLRPAAHAAVPEAPLPDGPVPQAVAALRPFVLTSGRVVGIDPTIGLETQVTARPGDVAWTAPAVSQLSPELRGIVALCAEPMSVAEISARLRLHVGVTKVLVGDLRAAGHLDVHTLATESYRDPLLIMRVIDGLRAIS
jgi:hypothetical protein